MVWIYGVKKRDIDGDVEQVTEEYYVLIYAEEITKVRAFEVRSPL